MLFLINALLFVFKPFLKLSADVEGPGCGCIGRFGDLLIVLKGSGCCCVGGFGGLKLFINLEGLSRGCGCAGVWGLAKLYPGTGKDGNLSILATGKDGNLSILASIGV